MHYAARWYLFTIFIPFAGKKPVGERDGQEGIEYTFVLISGIEPPVDAQLEFPGQPVADGDEIRLARIPPPVTKAIARKAEGRALPHIDIESDCQEEKVPVTENRCIGRAP